MSEPSTASTSTARPPNPLFAPISDDEGEPTPSSSKLYGPSSPGKTTDVKMSFDEAAYVDSDPDSDPDDPVVQTLPVFLTPALADSLALLQYPHRPPAPHTHHPLLPPALRPEPGQPDDRPRSARLTARYKPKVGHLEVSAPIEVREGIRQQRYNEERARDLGRGIQATDLNENGNPEPIKTVNGAGKQKESMLLYERGSDEPLERMLLAGETIPDQTWYACAVVKDNEVHLTPMTKTLQMRPHLSYLDRLGAMTKENARRERKAAEGGDSDDDSGGGASDHEEEAATTAQEVAARKQKKQAAADKKKAAGEVKGVYASIKGPGDAGQGVGDAKTGRAAASLFGPLKAAEQEQWLNMPVFDPTTDEANTIYDRLFAQKQDRLSMVTNATSYLRL